MKKFGFRAEKRRIAHAALERDLASRDPARVRLIADCLGETAFSARKPNFFIFDNVGFDQNQHSGFYIHRRRRGRWNSGREKKTISATGRATKEGISRPAHGSLPRTCAARWWQTMEKNAGLHIECHHHEVATGGQCRNRSALRYAGEIGRQHDDVQYVVRNVANQYGKTVTFMPKPLFADNGSGCTRTRAYGRNGAPLFAGDRYAG